MRAQSLMPYVHANNAPCLCPAHAAPLPQTHLLATTPVLLLLFAIPISLVSMPVAGTGLDATTAVARCCLAVCAHPQSAYLQWPREISTWPKLPKLRYLTALPLAPPCPPFTFPDILLHYVHELSTRLVLKTARKPARLSTGGCCQAARSCRLHWQRHRADRPGSLICTCALVLCN